MILLEIVAHHTSYYKSCIDYYKLQVRIEERAYKPDLNLVLQKPNFFLVLQKGRLVQKLQLLLMKFESRLTTRGCGAAAAFFCFFFNGVFFFFGVFFFLGLFFFFPSPFLFFCDVPGMSSSSCLFLQEGNELDYPTVLYSLNCIIWMGCSKLLTSCSLSCLQFLHLSHAQPACMS